MKKRRFHRIKKLFKSPSLSVSIAALTISILSVYIQFFNERHSVLYTTLAPEINKENNQITIPLLLKNTGNQAEVILYSELQLEVKESEGNYFKRISPYANKESYIILSPGDYKTINLVGNYKQYMFGKITLIGKNDFKYSPITVFDNLNLKISIKYLTKYGTVAQEEREIGKISFDKNEQVSRIDCKPIELKKLNLRNDEIEIISYSIIPNEISFKDVKIDLTDSLSFEKNLDKIQLFNRILKEQTENK